MRHHVRLAAPERRQQVHRLIGTQLEQAQLGVLGQFPAAVQQRATAGIGGQRIQFVMGEQLVAAGRLLIQRLGAGLGFLARHERGTGSGVGGAGIGRAAAQRLVVAGQAGGIEIQREAGLGRGGLGKGFLGQKGAAGAAQGDQQGVVQGRISHGVHPVAARGRAAPGTGMSRGNVLALWGIVGDCTVEGESRCCQVT
ncbi:hypothetical protein D3C81_1492830 [compost metagenome]